MEIYLYLIRPISACKFSNWDWAGYTAARNCNIDIVALIIQKGSSEVKSWNRIIDGAIEGGSLVVINMVQRFCTMPTEEEISNKIFTKQLAYYKALRY